MEIKGSVIFKKITPAGAIYRLILEGMHTTDILISDGFSHLDTKGEAVVSIPNKKKTK